MSIRWETGTVSHHVAHRPLLRSHATSARVVTRIEVLYADHTDEQIAAILNAEGQPLGFDKNFTATRVAHIRHRRNLKKYGRTTYTPVGNAAAILEEFGAIGEKPRGTRIVPLNWAESTC